MSNWTVGVLAAVAFTAGAAGYYWTDHLAPGPIRIVLRTLFVTLLATPGIILSVAMLRRRSR